MRLTDDLFKEFFLGEDGEVWRVVGYCEEPTITYERVRDGERRGGAVGSPITRQFRRLVPEGDA